MQQIRIGSRGSDLALWQANHVKRQLEALGCSVTIKIIKTQGDAIQHLSFDKLEGKGFFTKEGLINKQIKWFKIKPDTIHLINDFLKFNDTVFVGGSQLVETNRLSHLKVTIHNPNSKIYKVEISLNQQILKIVNNENEINSYLHSGQIESQIIEDYFPAGTIEIKVISNDLIEPKKLNFKFR